MAQVTVLIPTFNRRDYLKQALDSVFAQTFKDFDVLVSDNGSLDGTEELVRGYLENHPNLQYHRFPRNMGPAANGLYLLRAPEAEYVAILHDDDYWLPNHLEDAMGALSGTDNAVLYACALQKFGMSGDHVMKPMWADSRRRLTVLDPHVDFPAWLLCTPFVPSATVFKRSALNSTWALPRNDFTLGDWHLCGQMALQGKTVFDSKIGAFYRWHATNDSHSCRGKRFAVQFRYTQRTMAYLAFHNGLMTRESLVGAVTTQWPMDIAALLVVALASIDSPAELRSVAREIVRRRPGLLTDPLTSGHCRLAGRVGLWYLGWADIVDRLRGRWWPMRASDRGIELS